MVRERAGASETLDPGRSPRTGGANQALGHVHPKGVMYVSSGLPAPFRGPSLAGLRSIFMISTSSSLSHSYSLSLFLLCRSQLPALYILRSVLPEGACTVRPARTVRTTAARIVPNRPVRLSFTQNQNLCLSSTANTPTPYSSVYPQQKLAFCAIPPSTVRMPSVTPISAVGSRLVFVLTRPGRTRVIVNSILRADQR